MPRRVIIAAGGTGGHIFPALSIAAELTKNGMEILFIGNRNSMEEKLAKQAELAFAGIDVQKLHRSFTLNHLKFPYKLLKSILESKRIIEQFRPNTFVGTGGFVSGPAGFAAHLKKIPIYLQEQNSFPGLTTRMLSKYARKIFLGNPGAARFFPQEKLIFSGNPINLSVIQEKSKLDFKDIGLKPDSIKVFLFGGSQGSLILNRCFFPIIDDLLSEEIELIWQIGSYSFAEFFPKVKDKKGVYAFEFSNEIGKILNSVDFAICRGGALSLAELETKKIPSIIIPLPAAAGNHQYFNAMELVNKDVAIFMDQKQLNQESLFKHILQMKEKYLMMKENFQDSVHQNAVKKIADIICNDHNIKDDPCWEK